MTIVRGLVQLPYDTGLPKDVAVNVFHFNTGSIIANAATGALLHENLRNFYDTTAPGATAPVGDFLSRALTGTGTIDWYNLADATPRVPFYSNTFTVAMSVSAPFPNEVAVCLSFQGDPLSGDAQARRRGRVYIGPLGSESLTYTSPDMPRPGAPLITALVSAAAKLEDDAAADLLPWVVYSPTKDATLSLDASVTLVQNGWVDNEFDTQRRRGASATARTLWS